MKERLSVYLDPHVTRNCFETFAIEDFDVAAPIADHTGILQHTRRERYCRSPYTEHFRQKFLSEREGSGIMSIARMK